MKSKISLFNQAVFKRNLTGSWCLWAGLLVVYLLVLPVTAYSSMSATLKYSADTDSALLHSRLVWQLLTEIWSMGFFVPFFALAAILCAMNVFSYLFAGRNSNMMHTYPVTRISLFVTNYVTGILFLLIPLLLAGFLTMAVGAVCGAADGQIIKYCLIWMATVTVENLFFFSMAVCVLMFVGNIVAVPVLYLILNFLYDGCTFIIQTVISTVCYGLENELLTRSGLSVFTPIIYLVRVGSGNHITYDESGVQCTFDRMHVLPGYFAAAVLFAVIALAAYQKKHIETAGDVITVKWLKPIFRWGAAVCTSALGALFFSSIFYTNSFLVIISIAAVIGIFVFFFAQMLLERSVHIFTRRRIRECILYTAIVCVCYLALDLDVPGLEKKIPAVDEIQAVHTGGSIYLLAQDADEISWVHDIHSQIIASRAEFKHRSNNSDRPTKYISFQYLLKDGSIFKRSYQIPDLDEAGSVSAQIRAYACRPEVILKQFFGIHYPDIGIYGGKWSLYGDDGVQEVRVSETDAKQLYEAVVSDVCSGRIDEDPAVTDTTMETIGELSLEVRDEAGYVSAMDYYNFQYIWDAGFEKAAKDGTACINVDKRFSSLLEKMHELGYLSDEQ